MTQEQKHTASPELEIYYSGDTYEIGYYSDKPIDKTFFTLFEVESEILAQQIVLAYNNHYALLAIARECLDIQGSALEAFTGTQDKYSIKRLTKEYNATQAAIAKAEGK